MDNINYILSLIDWNNTLDQQAAGIKMAENIKDIQAFIQPCTESNNKNVWDNCALIISKRSDAELFPYLDNLFAWLQDMNWPGALCILEFDFTWWAAYNLPLLPNYRQGIKYDRLIPRHMRHHRNRK